MASDYVFPLIVDIDNLRCITATFPGFEYDLSDNWQSGLYSPQFRVKEYIMVDPSNGMADANFVTTSWSVRAKDSKSTANNDMTYCGEYQFDISIVSAVSGF